MYIYSCKYCCYLHMDAVGELYIAFLTTLVVTLDHEIANQFLCQVAKNHLIKYIWVMLPILSHFNNKLSGVSFPGISKYQLKIIELIYFNENRSYRYETFKADLNSDIPLEMAVLISSEPLSKTGYWLSVCHGWFHLHGLTRDARSANRELQN